VAEGPAVSTPDGTDTPTKVLAVAAHLLEFRDMPPQ
jgi:hypothetical protein